MKRAIDFDTECAEQDDEYFNDNLSKMRLIDANALEADCNIFDAWDAQIVKEWLKDQPTVDAKPVVRGYWKPIMMSEVTGWDLSLTGGYDEVCEYVCSQCNECANVGEDGNCILSKYCPNCGSKNLEDDTK